MGKLSPEEKARRIALIDGKIAGTIPKDTIVVPVKIQPQLSPEAPRNPKVRTGLIAQTPYPPAITYEHDPVFIPEGVEVCSICYGDEKFDHTKCKIIISVLKINPTKNVKTPSFYPTCPFCFKRMVSSEHDLTCSDCKFTRSDGGLEEHIYIGKVEIIIRHTTKEHSPLCRCPACKPSEFPECVPNVDQSNKNLSL